MGLLELMCKRALSTAHQWLDELAEEIVLDPGSAASRVLEVEARRAIVRAQRIGVLLVATSRTEWEPSLQRWLATELEALTAAAATSIGELEVRRFGTRVSLLDPVAAYRSGPWAVADLARKLVTGLSKEEALRQLWEDERSAERDPISEVSLRAVDLMDAQLGSTVWIDVNARRANLQGASAVESRWSRVSFAGAAMAHIDLQAALARDCDFTGADLTGARWEGGTVIRCCFAGARLTNLRAARALFLDCDFRRADWSATQDVTRWSMLDVQFRNCDLRGSSWAGRSMTRVHFVDCEHDGPIDGSHREAVHVDLEQPWGPGVEEAR